MTRIMLDALYPDHIPAPQPPGVMIAAYLGHSDNPDSYAQAVARFAGHQIVSIAAKTHHDAQILDIEHGAVEPNDTATINGWCARQRARGVTPTLYVNEATWPAVSGRVVGTRNWWAANWSKGPVIPPGAVGVQFGGVPGAFDTSILLDYIPGIDPPSPPPPPPSPLPKRTDDMLYDWLVPDLSGRTWLVAHDLSGRIEVDGPDLPALQGAHDSTNAKIYGEGLVLTDGLLARIPVKSI